ncbi:MAG TPA: hypothetical protein VK910_11490 [Thiobacillus sp.]|nr:hypothetical protein [Thiobacillus sp.]
MRFLDFSCLLAALLLSGCAAVTGLPATPADDPLAACRTLYRETDAAVERAGVRDQGPARISGFPYLRTNRLLASLRDGLADDTQWSAWAGHLASLDAEARALELRNLSAPLAGHHPETLRDELDRCRGQLLAADLADPERRVALRDAATVADDYVTWWRVAGLYPLTAPAVAVSIARWHARTHAVFATPLTALPVAGGLERWATPPGTPVDAADVQDILDRALDPLGIPLPSVADLGRLFDHFAPVWEVDVVDDDDRIGRPLPGPVVDVVQPTEYRLASHTRFVDRVLLQLNYAVWFPARPGNDIFAGRLDGLTWRVTLGPDGEPWMYDAIHNCGCYHNYFPTRHLRLRGDLPVFWLEPPLVPQSAPEGRPLVLRMAHATHYLQRVYAGDPPLAAQRMASEPYDALRSLPAGDGGRRSLFGAHGLVPGSERPERFILWPMGIRSPGAMRQWGRHPVAFVGRRHFDDPFLFESLFEETP